jgi:LacI family transcriptional regulator
VRVPYEELGRTTVRLALDGEPSPDAWDGQRVVLGTHVVVRESVARAGHPR